MDNRTYAMRYFGVELDRRGLTDDEEILLCRIRESARRANIGGIHHEHGDTIMSDIMDKENEPGIRYSIETDSLWSNSDCVSDCLQEDDASEEYGSVATEATQLFLPFSRTRDEGNGFVVIGNVHVREVGVDFGTQQLYVIFDKPIRISIIRGFINIVCVSPIV